MPSGFGQSHSRGAGVSGDAGGACGGVLVEVNSGVRWTLAKSGPMGKGTLWEQKAGESEGGFRWPCNCKMSSEPNEIGRRSFSPPGGNCYLWLFSSVESTICPTDICSGTSLVTEAGILGIIYFITTCCYKRVRVFTPRTIIFHIVLPPGHMDMYLTCCYVSSRVESTGLPKRQQLLHGWSQTDIDSNSYPGTY